ncbi:MAG: NAD(P)H-quinone oxidoreductase subunit 2, partial [Cyanobacteria bacterium J06639_1]
KLYIFWAGWQAGAYNLVLIGLITSVISIYYYIRVVKMMVVKEPQEMSAAVENYEAPDWTALGMRPLQLGMGFTLVATVLMGILSNPLFTLTTASVEGSEFLHAYAAAPQKISADELAAIAFPAELLSGEGAN